MYLQWIRRQSDTPRSEVDEDLETGVAQSFDCETETANSKLERGLDKGDTIDEIFGHGEEPQPTDEATELKAVAEQLLEMAELDLLSEEQLRMAAEALNVPLPVSGGSEAIIRLLRERVDTM